MYNYTKTRDESLKIQLKNQFKANKLVISYLYFNISRYFSLNTNNKYLLIICSPLSSQKGKIPNFIFTTFDSNYYYNM